MSGKFKGYYFKHQKDGRTVCFIPGVSDGGAFIQVITDRFSRRYDFPTASFGPDIRVGDCRFSPAGAELHLPGVSGRLRYRALTPIRSDIMGPFRFFPMECRHTVVSMRHELHGALLIDNERYDLEGGTGYIEGDSGRSFPRDYLWMQANDHPNLSAMLAIARIPFAGLRFQGVISVVTAGGKERRLATYLGARARMEGGDVLVTQGRLALRVKVISQGGGFSLAAPQNGLMRGVIKEHNNAVLDISLTDGDSALCGWRSACASFECHGYPAGQAQWRQ